MGSSSRHAITRATLALAVLSTAPPALAASIYGLEFGKPVTLPECTVDERATKSSGRTEYALRSAFQCQKQPAKIGGEPVPVIEIQWPMTGPDSPLGMNWSRAFVIVVDGGLAGFHFQTFGVRNQDEALARLTEKYGHPSTLSRDRVRNLGGAAFDSITATWRGAEVDVTFYGTAGKLDVGDVYIDLPAITRLRDGHLRSQSGPKM